LKSLKESFAVLAGAQPDLPNSGASKALFLTLSTEQIMSAIGTYRTALQEASSIDIIGEQKWPQISEIKTKTLKDIDDIENDLKVKTSEASANLRDLEKSIASSARSLWSGPIVLTISSSYLRWYSC